MTQNEVVKNTPFLVQVAAILIWLHGILMVMNAAAWAVGYQDWSNFYRALFRLVAVGAVGWGLLSLQRWAWWLAVIGGCLTALGNLLSILALRFLESSGHVVGGGFNMIVMMLSGAFLLGAVFYLVRPVSRAAFGFGQEAVAANSNPNTPPIPPPGPWTQ
jgi:drug/metabolite transporter (DMT)-like permease